MTIPAGPSGMIDIGYRFRETRDLSFKTDTANRDSFDDIDLSNQTVQVGYVYKFGRSIV